MDNGILLTRLLTLYGIHDRALEWFFSYLSDRRQFVKLNGSSPHVALIAGMAPGTCIFFSKSEK